MNTTPAANHNNPFPGLRPFKEEEEYLFFGRENQVDAMVDKLAATRFLAVVGTSGSGKSSLVNCGLRPALHGGLMASAGTAWRMAQFRPGSNPMRAMARALAEDGVLFKDYQAGGLTLAEIVDTTLRMSKLGLIDIYEQAQLGKDVNLLVVVDQFEELFRYRQFGAGHRENVYGMSEEAAAFVNLLLEVKEQTRYPIYVVLTMRSDFLGDCTQFTGLAEAINAGQYLVPRMTRDERRAAIGGPVGVGGSEISPVLLTRLVNDVGDNPDQLSILQHSLNRTWNQWERSGDNGPLDLPHYEAIGTMAHALDQHAERAYAELATARQQQICEKLFKALTDKATDPRGVRRPSKLGTLCALAEATPAEVTQVIDVFRKPSRSFLMPPAGDTLEAETVIDISHESLMRVWERLKTWADEEAQSAHIYSRLAETAVLHGEKKAGLWSDPDLQVALDWKEKNQPNEEWAQRYHPGFERAIAFLQASQKKRADDEAERARQQNAEIERAQRELQQAQALAEAQQQRAEAERQKAEEQQQRLEQQARAASALAEAHEQRAEAERQKAVEQQQRLDHQARAASRMRRLLAAFAVVALLAIASTVFAFSAYRRADKEKENAVKAEGVAKGEREKADAASKKAIDAESKAIKEKDNAENQRKAADDARRQAEIDRAEAVEANKLAAARAIEAEEQRKRAEAQTLLARDSAKKAETERQNAERERGEKQEQATTNGYFKSALDDLATANYQGAVGSLQAALKYFTDKKDTTNILYTHINIGDVYRIAYLALDKRGVSDDDFKAIESYDKAIEGLKTRPDDAKRLALTLEKAASLKAESNTPEEQQKAADYYEQARVVYHNLGLKDDEAARLIDVGKILSRSDNDEDVQKAKQAFDGAINVYAQAGNRGKIAETNLAIGDHYQKMLEKKSDDDDELKTIAADYFMAASAESDKVGAPDKAAEMLMKAGTVLSGSRLPARKSQAAEAFALAAQRYEKANNREKQSAALTAEMSALLGAAAVLEGTEGEEAAVLAFYDKAVAVYENDFPKQVATLIRIANSLARSTNEASKAKAETYFQKAVVLAERQADRKAGVSAYMDIAMAYQVLRQFRKAMTNFERSRTLYQELNDSYGLGIALYRLAVLHDEVFPETKAQAPQLADQSLALLAQTLPGLESSGDKKGLADGHYAMAYLYQSVKKDNAKALASYTSALALYEKMPNQQARARTIRTRISGLRSALKPKP